jgi:hypothetical protein
MFLGENSGFVVVTRLRPTGESLKPISEKVSMMGVLVVFGATSSPGCWTSHQARDADDALTNTPDHLARHVGATQSQRTKATGNGRKRRRARRGLRKGGLGRGMLAMTESSEYAEAGSPRMTNTVMNREKPRAASPRWSPTKKPGRASKLPQRFAITGACLKRNVIIEGHVE